MPPHGKKIPNRKSPRLKDYDYAQNGAYFVTICTQNRKHLFGRVINQQMILNDAGMMIHNYLQEISDRFKEIYPDLFVVMPNHIHVILMKTESQNSVSQIVQWFKRITTNKYIEGVKTSGWMRFDKRLWQQSFHDHIIRDEASLRKLREYTKYNPRLWEKDELKQEQ